jgi:hypothetical protein
VDWQQNGKLVGPCKHVLRLADMWFETLSLRLEQLQNPVDYGIVERVAAQHIQSSGWLDAAAVAFQLPRAEFLGISKTAQTVASSLWEQYAKTAEDDALDQFITHVGDSLGLMVQASKMTGDRSNVGFYLPVPEELADQFPSMEKIPPHVLLLQVGFVPKDRETEFIAVATKVLSMQPGPIIASIGLPDFFVDPVKDQRIWHSRINFSKDVIEIRDRLWLALETAGFSVIDTKPLAMFPHVLLAAQPGAHEHPPWKGPVPKGAWMFDSVEVWGLPKNVEIFLGVFDGEDFWEVAAPSKEASLLKDILPGGIGDDAHSSDFDKQQLDVGMQVEMEHTDDPSIAREIAMDHLTEDSNYYVKLKKIEKQGEVFMDQLFYFHDVYLDSFYDKNKVSFNIVRKIPKQANSITWVYSIEWMVDAQDKCTTTIMDGSHKTIREGDFTLAEFIAARKQKQLPREIWTPVLKQSRFQDAQFITDYITLIHNI